jgi:hypothetical protein
MNMPPIPDRMKKFPLWKGLYPIFYTVMMENGKPNFRVVSRARQIECANQNKCHMCGERMKPPYYFIGGPGSISSRHFSDGPMHKECAEYAAKACPFLSNPHARYSIQPVAKEHTNFEYVINHAIDAGTIRPAEMAVAWTDSYRANLTGQYPDFHAGTWIGIDWEIIPPRKDGT